MLSHITIVETTDSGEIGTNPVAVTIINPRKEYWPSRGLNQRSPVLQLYWLSSGARLHPFWELSAIFIKFKIVICKLFLFGRIWNLPFWKGLRLPSPSPANTTTLLSFLHWDGGRGGCWNQGICPRMQSCFLFSFDRFHWVKPIGKQQNLQLDQNEAFITDKCGSVSFSVFLHNVF